MSVLPTNGHVDRAELARFAGHFSIPLSQRFDLEPLLVDGPMVAEPPYPFPNTLWNLLTNHVAVLGPVPSKALASLSNVSAPKSEFVKNEAMSSSLEI